MSDPIDFFDIVIARVSKDETIRAQHDREVAEAKRIADLNAAKKDFISNFHRSVATHGENTGWSSMMLINARDYSRALVAEQGVLPEAGSLIMKVIHEKFAYGLVLQRTKGTTIPADTFVGQRQDWFPALFAEKAKGRGTAEKPVVAPPTVFARSGDTKPLAAVIDINGKPGNSSRRRSNKAG